MALHRSSNYKKAGLSGLFLLSLVAVSVAEPLKLEVKEASASIDQRTNESIVRVGIAEKSKQALADLTRDNVGKAMNFRLDGQVVVTPVIREPLLLDEFVVSGNFTVDKAAEIARRLVAGAALEVEIVR